MAQCKSATPQLEILLHVYYVQIHREVWLFDLVLHICNVVICIMSFVYWVFQTGQLILVPRFKAIRCVRSLKASHFFHPPMTFKFLTLESPWILCVCLLDQWSVLLKWFLQRCSACSGTQIAISFLLELLLGAFVVGTWGTCLNFALEDSKILSEASLDTAMNGLWSHSWENVGGCLLFYNDDELTI